MYRITITPSLNMVEIVLAGMLSVEETATYIAELRHRMVVERLRPGYVMLLDASGCTIQTQEMVAAMRDHMATIPKASAIAVVVGGSLARMQVRRLFVQPYARIVATVDQARAWILDGTEPVEQPARSAGAA